MYAEESEISKIAPVVVVIKAPVGSSAGKKLIPSLLLVSETVGGVPNVPLI
jgi:hypothetical protein